MSIRLLVVDGGPHTVHARHPDVHQGRVGPQLPGPLDRLPAATGLTDHLKVVLGRKEQPETRPDQILVAGAAGFLITNAPWERLIEAIPGVHADDALLSLSVTRRLIADFASHRRTTRAGHWSAGRADPANARYSSGGG